MSIDSQHMADQADNNLMSLAELFRVLVKRWVLLLSIAFVAAVLALIGTLFVEPSYRAEAVLASTKERNSISVSQLGGLASLASFVGSPGFEDPVQETLAVLKSRQFAQWFLRETQGLPVLFPKRWDFANQRWLPRKCGVVQKLKWFALGSTWSEATDPRRCSPQPSASEAFRVFENVRKVRLDRETGLIHVTVQLADPALASQWVQQMVELCNRFLRDRDAEDATRNIAFIEAELQKTNSVELRATLAKMLERELKIRMQTASRPQYALRTIDPATAPDRPVGPQRLLISFGCALLAAIVSLIYLCMREGSALDPNVSKDSEGYRNRSQVEI